MNTIAQTTIGKTIELNFFQPYNLTGKNNNSDLFYQKLANVSKLVVNTGMDHFKADIVNFRQAGYVNENQSKKSDDELLLEILMIGVFWNNYQGKWNWNIQFITPIFKTLLTLRSTFLKKKVDRLRGILGSKWLNKERKEDVLFDIDQFNNLILWLSATGDFKTEVEMLNQWLKFFYADCKRKSYEILAEASAFASWFESYTKKQFEEYTNNADTFILQNKNRYKNREDQFFCTRNQVEYHMNMVGAQIMNESLKEEFLQTKKQILLLPACMVKNTNCKAIYVNNSLICQHCTPGCNVAKTSDEMKNSGVDTVLIKHASNFTEWLKPWADQKSTGLIGTACVLNLLGGGLEMKKLGIPSQCVFLDSCGCKNHWDKHGIPTQINIEKAKDLVGPKFKREQHNVPKKQAV